MPVRGRRRRADRGAAAVETALVLPLLLIVVFAIIDFGRMLNAQIKVTEAAREGARALSLVSRDEADRTAAVVMGSDRAGSTPGADRWTSTAASNCVNTASPEATYEVVYSFGFVTPLGFLIGEREDGIVSLSAKAVMPCRA